MRNEDVLDLASPEDVHAPPTAAVADAAAGATAAFSERVLLLPAAEKELAEWRQLRDEARRQQARVVAVSSDGWCRVVTVACSV